MDGTGVNGTSDDGGIYSASNSNPDERSDLGQGVIRALFCDRNGMDDVGEGEETGISEDMVGELDAVHDATGTQESCNHCEVVVQSSGHEAGLERRVVNGSGTKSNEIGETGFVGSDKQANANGGATVSQSGEDGESRISGRKWKETTPLSARKYIQCAARMDMKHIEEHG